MERILLYYPSTNIPNGSWLRNSLLYTDKVSSILPYGIDSDRVADEMKFLYDEGQYTPMLVFQELNPFHEEFGKFEKNFLAVIDSRDFRKITKHDRTEFVNDQRILGDYEMFVNKFTPDIAEYLRKKHLMTKTENDYEVAVEKNTAAIYMSMLANYLSCINSNLMIPSTDEQEFERLAYQLADKKVLTYRMQLHNCLPAPSPDSDLKEVIKFKLKRRAELLQFREVLDKAEDELNSAVGRTEQKEKMIQFQERIQREIIEVRKLLGDSKLEYVLGGFSSLLDLKEKEVFGTFLGLGIGGAGLVASLPILGAGAGLFLLAGTLVSSFKKINRQVEAKSSSYIYYAQKEGILQT